MKSNDVPLYAESPRASNVSIAGGAVKLLSVVVLIAAIGCTAVLALAAVRLAAMVPSLWFVLDELEDGLGAVFFLWAAFALCRYLARMLARKAALLAARMGQDA